MSLLCALTKKLIYIVVFCSIVILLPNLPPRTTFPFTAFQVSPPKELKGALEINHHLDGAERLLDGRIYGPECLLSRNNEIYMGIHGGEIVKVDAMHVTHVTKLGQPCEDIVEESRCGRPLGFAFDTLGNNLIIADAYYGIWQVNFDAHIKTMLVSPHQLLPGKNVNYIRPAKIFNSVAVDKQGDIYWTDSSSDVTLQDLLYALLANPSGRLFKYDRKKNESKLLLDELYFANGVALSPDESFIVVAETGSMRLIKYHLKGLKAGQSEIFVDGLPGMPDNLTPDADGIWVPLIFAADSEHPSIANVFSNFPKIRLLLARMLALIEMPFKLCDHFYSNKVCKLFIHYLGHGESTKFMAPARATVVRLDWNGNIVGSLHGFDKSVGGISHVIEHNNYLLFGSPFNRYVARVKSPKPAKSAQRNIRISNVRYEGAADMEPKLSANYERKTETEATIKTAESSTTKSSTTTTTTTTSTTTTTTPKPSITITKATATPTPAQTKQQTARTVPPAKESNFKRTTSIPTTIRPRATIKPRTPPDQPAPVKEELPKDDIVPPKQEKLKVIDKHGKHVEL